MEGRPNYSDILSTLPLLPFSQRCGKRNHSISRTNQTMCGIYSSAKETKPPPASTKIDSQYVNLVRMLQATQHKVHFTRRTGRILLWDMAAHTLFASLDERPSGKRTLGFGCAWLVMMSWRHATRLTDFFTSQYSVSSSVRNEYPVIE